MHSTLDPFSIYFNLLIRDTVDRIYTYICI